MKIGLFCVAGVSTAMLLHKLQNELTKQEISCELVSAPIADVFSKGTQMDLIILSPHARFNLKKVESVYPEKQILLMAEQDFKTMNVKNLVNQIEASFDLRQAK